MSEHSSFEHPPVGVIISRKPHSPNFMHFDFSPHCWHRKLDTWQLAKMKRAAFTLPFLCHVWVSEQITWITGFRTAKVNFVHGLIIVTRWNKWRDRDGEFLQIVPFLIQLVVGNKGVEMDDRQAVSYELLSSLFSFFLLASCTWSLLAPYTLDSLCFIIIGPEWALWECWTCCE